MKNYLKQSILILSLPLMLFSCKSEPKDETKENNSTEVNSEEKASPNYVGEEITYMVNGNEFTGYLAYNANATGSLPGVLVVHEWWGHDDYARMRADELAKLGYVGLALDMYGKGKKAGHPKEAMAFSNEVMSNLEVAEQRFDTALKLLKAHKMTNPEKTAAIGYCFGGSVALTMANAGKDLDAVAAFHSGVALPVMPNKDLKAKILVCNGAEDKMVTDQQITDFKKALDEVNADYKYVSYEGVMHSYTNPKADSLGKKFDLPLAYNKEADEKSWEELKAFLEATF